MYVDPGGNLVNAFRSQQDNRFRHKQLETDKALRERGLNLQEDEWNTRKGWQQDEFDREARRKAVTSEAYGNLYDEIGAEQAHELGREEWEKDMMGGENINFFQMFGLGGKKQTFNDWLSQKSQKQMHKIGGMTYDDVHPEGAKYKKRKDTALMDLKKMEELDPELFYQIMQTQQMSPNTEGLTQKSLIDLLTEFRESY